MKLRTPIAAAALAALWTGCCPSVADADPYYYPGDAKQYGDSHSQVICNSVGQEPSPHGIWATVSVLLSQERYLNYTKMQSAVGWAINQHCPQFNATYSQYRAIYP